MSGGVLLWGALWCLDRGRRTRGTGALRVAHVEHRAPTAAACVAAVELIVCPMQCQAESTAIRLRTSWSPGAPLHAQCTALLAACH